MPLDLRTAWRELLQTAGVDPDAAEGLFAELIAAYSEPGRHYHNLDHIRRVLVTIDRLRAEAHDLISLRCAAWFHDAVYDPRASDNEERSAEWAAQALESLSLPTQVVANTRRLILLSKTHQPDPADADGCLFIDADLAVLGSEEAEYRSYAQAIRREYAWVADDAYRAGRGRVLHSFLARPRIYATGILFESLEGCARRNLEMELQELSTMNPSTAYPPRIADLLSEERLNPLDAGSPDETMRARLRGVTVEELFAPQTIRDKDMAAACLAGLWLRADCLDESHRISQDIDTPTGSYWHAIMHRREPDAANSKYWWRRVGPHPVLKKLAEQAPALGYQFTDSFGFVDFVERVRDTDTPDEELAKRVQQLEWQLLFDHCYRAAMGGNARLP